MSVSLRKVRKKDWNYILSLRNDENYRSFFYEQHIISKKEHQEYLKKQETNPNFVNWIITYKNNDVGYVRILESDISIIIEEKFFGKGIGTQAIKLIEFQAKKMGLKKLIGKVMIHNEKSKKIFENNNFKLKMYWFEKEL